jgi:hypothetical protein
MAHVVDLCDIIDMLEESATTGRAVVVELDGGHRFTDRVTEVDTHDGQDFVTFREHGHYPVRDIRDCSRAEPPPLSYAGKS